MSLVKSWVWPEVSIRRKAQSVINEAFGAATVVAVQSLIFALMSSSSESNSSDRLVILIARVVFGLRCIGIFLRSRIAAVSALVLFPSPSPSRCPLKVRAFSSLRPRYLHPVRILPRQTSRHLHLHIASLLRPLQISRRSQHRHGRPLLHRHIPKSYRLPLRLT